ncbi:MAG: Gfo/Idh/MocA family oxidoreductase [Clostridia bacterium]|nr:Gfo/Idh/MocA family oxidoreductase [Clostridia bacterium]
MKAIVIGAGGRGLGYAKRALTHPDKLQIVGVAEPLEERRESVRTLYNVPQENCFTTWEDVFNREKFADAVMICTQDQMHYEPTMKAIEKGYHILLEKPVSPNPEECLKIADAAEKKGVKVVVCHVLRFAPFFVEMKKAIINGDIGEIVSVVHNENVGNSHQAHSFVRGAWRNTAQSSPMILAKSCHDTDIMQWLIGKKCLKLSSFGSLKYFKKENCPEGAPPRCTDGCPYGDECFYDTRKLYFPGHTGYREWYRRIATSAAGEVSDERVMESLKTTQYGKCVFQCDNDVVDHQVVSMEFEDGITALFSMSAFTPETSRTIKIMGTKGEIRASMAVNKIEITDFLTYTTRTINLENLEGIDGHGGGDNRMIDAFCDYIDSGVKDIGITDILTTVNNHMISFMAEKSRQSGGKLVELSR